MIYARGWVSHPARVVYVDVGDAGADTSVRGVCALGNALRRRPSCASNTRRGSAVAASNQSACVCVRVRVGQQVETN
jgi:hypothetical protein